MISGESLLFSAHCILSFEAMIDTGDSELASKF